jgi:hypothetical protein
MSRQRPVAPAALFGALVAALLASACATSKDPTLGHRALEATVVDRRYDPPGTGGASYRGSGNYYLVFEAREGDSTSSRYTFQVTQAQYQRFSEGANVQIILYDNNLKDIRRLP